MATQIHAFNCHPSPVVLLVRSQEAAYQFSSGGPGNTPAWAPGTPDTAIAWGGANPYEGQLGFGTNPCTLDDGHSFTEFNIVIPTGVLPTDSLELYLFHAPAASSGGNGTVGYVLLKDGLPFGADTSGFNG